MQWSAAAGSCGCAHQPWERAGQPLSKGVGTDVQRNRGPIRREIVVPIVHRATGAAAGTGPGGRERWAPIAALPPAWTGSHASWQTRVTAGGTKRWAAQRSAATCAYPFNPFPIPLHNLLPHGSNYRSFPQNRSRSEMMLLGLPVDRRRGEIEQRLYRFFVYAVHT